jgi:hypothetical protein
VLIILAICLSCENEVYKSHIKPEFRREVVWFTHEPEVTSQITVEASPACRKWRGKATWTRFALCRNICCMRTKVRHTSYEMSVEVRIWFCMWCDGKCRYDRDEYLL